MGAPDQAPQAADLLGPWGMGQDSGVFLELTSLFPLFRTPLASPGPALYIFHDEGYRKRMTCWYMKTQCNGWRVYAKLSVHIGV